MTQVVDVSEKGMEWRRFLEKMAQELRSRIPGGVRMDINDGFGETYGEAYLREWHFALGVFPYTKTMTICEFRMDEGRVRATVYMVGCEKRIRLALVAQVPGLGLPEGAFYMA